MFGSYVIISILCFLGVLCQQNPSSLCTIHDSKCLTKLGNIIFKQAVLGEPALGIECLDPLHSELVEGNLPAIQFKLWNSTFIGFKDIEIKEISVPENKTLIIVMLFPIFILFGNYKIEGNLRDDLPIRGEGEFIINGTNYEVHLYAKKDHFERDGKKYIHLISYETKSELLGDLRLDLKNLFDGRKDLAAPVQKFIHDNPKAVASLMQYPVIQTNFKKPFENFNKKLDNFPLDDYVIL